jgi:FkbM family methyltransferase
MTLIQKIKNKIFPPKAVLLVPSWHSINSGILKDHLIFVNDYYPSFREMISGEYDSFFWDHLNEKDIAGATVIDIGAHIGYHTMAFAKLAGPNGHVLSFEPNRFNLARISMNLAKNPDLEKQVQCFNIALSDKNGEVEFTFSADIENETSSGGFIENSNKPLEDRVYRHFNFVKETVPVKKLDDIILPGRFTRVSLIKIDVEGAEAFVLKGALNVIQNHHPLLLIEIHSVYCMKEVVEILISLQYESKIINEDGPGRCFIAAEFKGNA